MLARYVTIFELRQKGHVQRCNSLLRPRRLPARLTQSVEAEFKDVRVICHIRPGNAVMTGRERHSLPQVDARCKRHVLLRYSPKTAGSSQSNGLEGRNRI